MNTSFFSRIPPVTKNLIIINLLVWLAMFVLPRHIGANLEDILGLHYFTATDFNPVQLLSYMFMHSRSTLAHIFFNMFTLIMLGPLLERTFGSGRFLFYYISCGIGAALIQELWWTFSLADLIKLGSDLVQIQGVTINPVRPANEWLNMAVTIGASGAIYGILLAFGMLFPDMPMYLMFIPVPIKAKYMVIGMGVIELLIGLGSAVGIDDGVAHFAHLGGMVFGLLIILYWKKKGLFNNYGGY